MKLLLSPNSLDDYERFLKIKSLPKYRFTGRSAEFPDEYAGLLNMKIRSRSALGYSPIEGLFDYQRDIAEMAIRKRKFAAFVRPGLGKTLIEYEFGRHAQENLPKRKCVLIIEPSMVIRQAMGEAERFYRDQLPIRRIKAHELSQWLESGTERFGMTNYESLREDTPQGRLGALILDESSMLKSAYGKWGTTCIRLGRGLDWKLAATGTPAPNDRIEYANHAVFLDQYPTVNSFLARFFVNRGRTQNRWELKPHALRAFYNALSHWSIFMVNPATYGWKDNCGTIPPIKVHIHDVELSDQQKRIISSVTGDMFGMNVGGITRRSTLSQVAKGRFNGQDIQTHKPEFIRRLIDSWAGESTLTWCKYNKEQESIASAFPEAASLSGDTPEDIRDQMISDFQSGKQPHLISKGKLLGFGLNLQIATRQVFSGLEDSYETFYQCIMRSNRVGSTKPLNVHIPVTAAERPMVQTVLDKAHRVEVDAEEQEKIFMECRNAA